MTEEDRLTEGRTGQEQPFAEPEESKAAQGQGESLSQETGEDLPGEEEGRGVEDLEAELEEMKDSVLRARADFENFRKRMKREQGEISDRVAMSLLGELLPVMDNFERAISTVHTADMESFAQGVQMIFRQMTDVLEAQGVKRMNVEGAPFDPRVHEAVSVVESDEVQDEICSEEVIPGYTYKYKVLRPAQVQVAKPKQAEVGEEEGENVPVKGVSWRELHQRLGENEQDENPSQEDAEEKGASEEGMDNSSAEVDQ